MDLPLFTTPRLLNLDFLVQASCLSLQVWGRAWGRSTPTTSASIIQLANETSVPAKTPNTTIQEKYEGKKNYFSCYILHRVFNRKNCSCWCKYILPRALKLACGKSWPADRLATWILQFSFVGFCPTRWSKQLHQLHLCLPQTTCLLFCQKLPPHTSNERDRCALLTAAAAVHSPEKQHSLTLIYDLNWYTGPRAELSKVQVKMPFAIPVMRTVMPEVVRSCKLGQYCIYSHNRWS